VLAHDLGGPVAVAGLDGVDQCGVLSPGQLAALGGDRCVVPADRQRPGRRGSTSTGLPQNWAMAACRSAFAVTTAASLSALSAARPWRHSSRRCSISAAVRVSRRVALPRLLAARARPATGSASSTVGRVRNAPWRRTQVDPAAVVQRFAAPRDRLAGHSENHGQLRSHTGAGRAAGAARRHVEMALQSLHKRRLGRPASGAWRVS